MRRKGAALSALMALVGASVLLLVPAASAQTGYPPGPCTVLVGDSGNLATGSVGQTLTLTLTPECLFTPGSTVSITINGQAAGTKIANADGSVTVTVNILSTTLLGINPNVPGHCGVNEVSSNGPSENAGQNVTQIGRFTVLCPAAAAQPVRGRVAFTGGNILRWCGVALFLVAVGGALVMADRRRGRKRA